MNKLAQYIVTAPLEDLEGRIAQHVLILRRRLGVLRKRRFWWTPENGRR